MKKKKTNTQKTSWEPVQGWYQKIVGKEGHYYHQEVILPNLITLLNLQEERSSILDLACGNGILGRLLPKNIDYVGVDIAPSLIRAARSLDKNKNHHYLTGDITKPLQKLPIDSFTHGTIVLALQNIEKPEKAIANAAKHVEKLFIVLNHPCFRIPRQTSWEFDEKNKQRYRRVNRYLSSMTIPITAHPSKGKNSEKTLSYHHSLSMITQWLHDAGLVIEKIEEWTSNKISTGKRAKTENLSRREIPLFLTLQTTKF